MDGWIERREEGRKKKEELEDRWIKGQNDGWSDGWWDVWTGRERWMDW